MTKALKINKKTEQGVLDFLKYIIESKKVSGVFTLKKINKNESVAYSLITDVKDLDDAVPFYPLMPVNAGKLLSRFSLNGPPDKKIAAVVKPCELRGFIELIKRKQGSLDNIIIISLNCGGVYPTKFGLDKTLENNLTKYWDDVKKGDIPKDIRPTCKSCEEFKPYMADITFDILGKNDLDKQCMLYLNTARGQDVANGFKGDFSDKEIDNKKLEKISEKRKIEKEKLFDEIGKKMDGIDGLINIFGKCISCHGCSKVCPICYCVLCEFESSDSEYNSSYYESELRKKPGLRVPPGTIYYHLGRLSHIAISCVACGACDDVCPVDIPISMIFKKVGESVQKMFDYIPGKDVDEMMPLITFENEELTEYEG